VRVRLTDRLCMPGWTRLRANSKATGGSKLPPRNDRLLTIASIPGLRRSDTLTRRASEGTGGASRVGKGQRPSLARRVGMGTTVALVVYFLLVAQGVLERRRSCGHPSTLPAHFPPPNPPRVFAHGSFPSAVYNTPTHKPCHLPARLRSLATWAVDRLAQVSVRDYTQPCRLRRQSGPSRELAQSRRYFLAKESWNRTPTTYLSAAFSRM